MMVTQRYNDMLIVATEKLREVDAQLNECMGMERYDRPMLVLKDDDEAFFTLAAMSKEYQDKMAMIQLLKRNRAEVMEELFSVFQ